MGQLVGQRSIIGQQDQPLAVEIQPPTGKTRSISGGRGQPQIAVHA